MLVSRLDVTGELHAKFRLNVGFTLQGRSEPDKSGWKSFMKILMYWARDRLCKGKLEFEFECDRDLDKHERRSEEEKNRFDANFVDELVADVNKVKFYINIFNLWKYA